MLLGEMAIDQNLKLLRTIECAMEGIALLNENGFYEYVNKAHADMFGFESSAEMIGSSWKILYEEPEIAMIQNIIFPLLMQRGYWRGEIVGKKQNGIPIDQEVYLSQLPGGGLACFCRDITKRKLRHEQLRHLAIVAEKTNSIVMTMDSNNKITWVNESFKRITGCQSKNIIGRDPTELLKTTDKNNDWFSEMMHTLKSCGLFSGELKIRTKKRTEIWLFMNIAATNSADNKTTHYVAVMNDITAMKEAEILLQESIIKERTLNQLKTEFISLTSHQIRTPLATIRSSIDMLDLKLEAKNPEKFITLFRRYKDIIIKEIGRMTELMENILDISRIEEKKVQLSKRGCSMQAFMKELVESSQEPGYTGPPLVYRFNAPDNNIDIDPVLIRNALRNIISNAFKYSSGCRSPELTVFFKNDMYYIIIKDYGIGIPEEDQPLLFQSFFRAHNTKHLPGCGLGLMIAKNMIEAHNGKINLKSQINAGCEVTITLPCLQPDR